MMIHGLFGKRFSYVFVAVLFLVFILPIVSYSASFPDLVPLVKQLKPVVVNISTKQTSKKHKKSEEMLDGLKNSPFEKFFRQFRKNA